MKQKFTKGMELINNKNIFLIESVLEKYYDNDTAHNYEHIIEVVKRALDMNSSLNLKLDEDTVITVSLFHDSDMSDRANHHILSAEMYKSVCSEYGLTFNSDIYEAIKEHRASYKGKFTSILSELISAADRGEPDSIETLFRRSIKYNMNEKGIPREEANVNAFKHINEKYGRGGYMRKSAVYDKYYADEIENLYVALEKSNIDDVRNIKL